MTDLKPGDFVPAVPRRVRPDNSPYNWEAMALLARERPGETLCAAIGVPRGAVATVRAYNRPPFRDRRGQIHVRQQRDDSGTYTVYFTYKED